MAYNLQPSSTGFTGGKNILASEHVQFIEVGATMDSKKFPVGTVALGTLVARNTTTGKFEPFSTATGYEDFGVLNIDFVNDGAYDTIVGEIIVRGSVYADKLPTAPVAAFKTANPMIRYITAR